MTFYLRLFLALPITAAALVQSASGAEPYAGPKIPPALPALVISEFLARNHQGLRDENGDSSDWIEIRNPGTNAVDLAGWHLTDSGSHPRKWTFPATNLAGKAYLLVFASGKDRAVPGLPLHTNFKLSAKGGSLWVVSPGGAIVDGYADYPAQEANVSFGRAEESGSSENEWRYLLRPTPGRPNGAGARTMGSAIRSVTHSPEQVAGGSPIKVSARIASGSARPSEVTLHYRVMFDSEQALVMTEEGEWQSGAHQERLFKAIIPASAATPASLIRWYVTASVLDVQSRWPLNAGDLHLPQYLGTVIKKRDVSTALPVYDCFVEGYQFPGLWSHHTGIDSDAGARGAVYAFGQLYDNVFIRIKGTTSRHLFKRSHRINFNPGYEFHWDASEPPIRELSLNAEYPDPSYARQYLSCWLQRKTGTGAAPHFPVRAQMNGQFWELAFHTMPANDELLRFMGLDPQGALYKQAEQITAEGRLPAKKTRRGEDPSDYLAFAEAINDRVPVERRRIALFDQTDLPTVINYIAVTRITHEADDVWANMVLYRDTNGSGEWRPVPFDLNLSFGQLFYDGDEWNTVLNATNDLNKSHPLYGSSATKTHYPPNRFHPSDTHFNFLYNRLYDAVIRVPETRSMLLRRMRTLMDEYLKPPGTPLEELPIEKELDALAVRILPEAELDRKRWGWPPNNPYFGVYGLSQNYPPDKGIRDIKDLYLAPRRVHLYITHSLTNTDRAIGIRSSDNAGIPLSQTLHPNIQFGVMEISADAIALNQDYVQLLNTNSFAVDLSGWKLEGGLIHRFKAGTVVAPGSALYLSPKVVSFRARHSSPKGGEGAFVQGNYQRNGAFDAEQTVVLRDETGTVIATGALPMAR